MNYEVEYEIDQSLLNLRPNEIRTLNRTLRKGIESKGKFEDVIKENLTILTESLAKLLDKMVFTEDMIEPLKETQELIDDLIFLNYYPSYIKSKLLLAMKLLKDYLNAISKFGYFPEKEKAKKEIYPYKYKKEDYEKFGYPKIQFERLYSKYGANKTYQELKEWYLNLWRNNENMRTRDIRRMLKDDDRELSRDEIGRIEVLSFRDAVTELFGGISSRDLRTFEQIRAEKEQEALNFIRQKLKNSVETIQNLSDKTVSELSKSRDLDEILNKISEGIIRKGMKKK